MTPMPAPIMLDDYLTVTQAARLLGISRQWARRFASSGQVRALHSPYGWLIERASAQALAERRAAAQGVRRPQVQSASRGE